MRLFEALKKLNEIDAPVPVEKGEVVVVGDDLNERLIKKIAIIADALAHAFEKEGIELDAKLIADDIRRDCGLMGGIVDTDELDVEGNPFDAATKEMHDMGPVDTNKACQMLLAVEPHEFVSVFLNGLKRNRGLLPGPAGRRELPHRAEPRRLKEAKQKDYSYIISLADKYASQINEVFDLDAGIDINVDARGQSVGILGGTGSTDSGGGIINAGADLDEEILAEKITDLKGYFKGSKNKEKFEKIGMSEKDWIKLAEVDPTHKKGSNGGGDYLEWLLRLITSGTTTFRDIMGAAHEYTDQLSAFDDLKKRKRLPADKRDIMQVRTLEDLMNLVATRGVAEEPKEPGEEGEPEEKKAKGSMSDFKQDLQDFPALCQKLTWPDKVEGTYEDHMELVGENDKWEVWKVKSPLGAFVFDQWGEGAKWCVGGFGYKGADGKRSAENYYPNYLNGGKGCYVCFQQKNKGASRPTNKALITFNDESRYGVSQFNHSNNGSYYSGGYSANTSDEFARFLSEENLLDVLKGTEFGNCESIKDVETAERLKNGEPYLYSGEKVKPQFKEAIKKVVFDKEYSRKIKLRRNDAQVELIGIPENAFKDCKNLEEVDMPKEIEAIGFHAFMNCDKAVIKTPAHRVSCFPQDVEYIKAHMIYTDEPAQAKEEKPEEEKPE